MEQIGIKVSQLLYCILQTQITLTTEFVPLGGNSYECQYKFDEMTFSRSATNNGSVFMCESPSEEQLRPIVQANRGERRNRAQRRGRRVERARRSFEGGGGLEEGGGSWGEGGGGLRKGGGGLKKGGGGLRKGGGLSG